MEIMEWTREHKLAEAKKLAMALVGILAFCIGVNWFIVPIGLYNGGFVGIGQVVRTALIEYAHMDFGDFDIAGLIGADYQRRDDKERELRHNLCACTSKGGYICYCTCDNRG